MKTACSLVPPRFEDGRHRAILLGMQAAGFRPVDSPDEAEVLVTWNLHRAETQVAASNCLARGGRIVVCEEAYTRRLTPVPQIAMALDGHNGAGRWFPGGPERWRALGVALKPWRRQGRHVLVCAGRGMGAPGLRQPTGWTEDVCRRLRRLTDREIRLRSHPGKGYRQRPLAPDLEDAWAVVVWASNCATHALVEGVPVFHEAPALITADAAERGIAGLEHPRQPDRVPVFERLAWAQWSLEEVADGAPFRHLLRRPTTVASKQTSPEGS